MEGESQTSTTSTRRKTAGANLQGGAQNVLGTVTECRHLARRATQLRERQKKFGVIQTRKNAVEPKVQNRILS